MVKYIFGKCYTNSVAVTTTLGGGDHGMLGYLMSDMLYEMVSRILFAVPTTPVLAIPPISTHLW